MPAFSSLVWLVAGGVLQLFGFGKWNIPITAWLVPAFLLRFSRGAEPAQAALAIWLVLWAAFSVALRPGPHRMPDGKEIRKRRHRPTRARCT